MAERDAVALFEGVSHRFGERVALAGVSLSVRRGDVYGLLGLNGAGKTTSLRLLLQLLRRQSGRIELFGELAERGGPALLGRLGAMIEAPAFYPQLDGHTNLALLHELAGGAGRGPLEALELVGLREAGGTPASRYSQGMLQRLYLAQALLGRPELLVLDEPTSNLDPQGILDVRRLVLQLAREHGTSVILSSHQLSEVEDLCNRVAILHRGRCLVQSELTELLRGEECWVELEIDRPALALELLARIPWCQSPGPGERGALRVRIPRARCAQLNRELVKADFAVAGFAPQPARLEDFFHRTIQQESPDAA
jgi:ABC-type multidrug transport system ATPase subunit